MEKRQNSKSSNHTCGCYVNCQVAVDVSKCLLTIFTASPLWSTPYLQWAVSSTFIDQLLEYRVGEEMLGEMVGWVSSQYIFYFKSSDTSYKIGTVHCWTGVAGPFL